MEIKHLYLIAIYQPNTAATNRFISFVKGFSELGVNVLVYILELNDNFEQINNTIKNVEFNYLFSKCLFRNRLIRCFLQLASFFYVICRIKKNCSVIVYNGHEFMWVLRLRKDLKIYHERSEHPEEVGKRDGFFGTIIHKLYLRTCKKIDGIFVISPSLQHYFIDELNIKKNKIHIINMIVDPSRFKYLNGENKNNSITYCGTISIKKDGILTLIKSFNIVSKKYNDIILTLIGDFENLTTKNEVYNLINKFGLKDRIIQTGSVSSLEMPFLLSNSRVLALSRPNNRQSKYGFATKLGEYLLSGTPSVITDVGDFKLYLENNKDIIFAKADNEIDFADKLIWVLDNYTQAKKIANNGKITALKHFNYIIESQKIIDIIFH